MPKEKLYLKAIAFDLGNVLVKVDHQRFCKELARIAKTTPEDIFSAIFESGLESRFDTGRLSERDFYERVRKHLGLSVPFLQFCLLWNEIFEPMERIEEILERLYPRYPLFLLSNTNSLHFSYIEKRFIHIIPYFESFILSYLVGSRKPEPGIYQALIKEMGARPERCLFVDDKLPFVEAAREHSLVAWHFTDPQDFCRRLTEQGVW
ncbi:MAG: HAD family phosphatase [Deltaproteobacteria bacterium]|nr:HAD family phosphatase [Deltaproteobacteria bacterium]